MQYYELEFGRKGCDSYFMVIKAVRQPSIEEANTFCASDCDLYGMPIIRIDPIPEDVARSCYDFSNEENWPVFGL